MLSTHKIIQDKGKIIGCLSSKLNQIKILYEF